MNFASDVPFKSWIIESSDNHSWEKEQCPICEQIIPLTQFFTMNQFILNQAKLIFWVDSNDLVKRLGILHTTYKMLLHDFWSLRTQVSVDGICIGKSSRDIIHSFYFCVVWQLKVIKVWNNMSKITCTYTGRSLKQLLLFHREWKTFEFSGQWAQWTKAH